MEESTGSEETGTAEMFSWDQANRRQKMGFGLEKQKENQPNYQRLLSLTVLPLTYFMGGAVGREGIVYGIV